VVKKAINNEPLKIKDKKYTTKTLNTKIKAFIFRTIKIRLIVFFEYWDQIFL